MSFSCGLADRGLCDELITRAQESYRVGPGSKGLLRHGKIMRIGGMILTRETDVLGENHYIVSVVDE